MSEDKKLKEEFYVLLNISSNLEEENYYIDIKCLLGI